MLKGEFSFLEVFDSLFFEIIEDKVFAISFRRGSDVSTPNVLPASVSDSSDSDS